MASSCASFNEILIENSQRYKIEGIRVVDEEIKRNNNPKAKKLRVLK